MTASRSINSGNLLELRSSAQLSTVPPAAVALSLPVIPRFRDKYGQPSVTGPEVFGEVPLEIVPRTLVMCLTKFLDPAVEQVLTAHTESFASKVIPDLHFLNSSTAILRNRNFLGGPLATVQLERLIHLGVRSFVIFGIAGSLTPQVDIGQVVVCDRAIRDEGTSHHYLPPSDYARPTRGVPEQLVQFLATRGVPAVVGGTWTTDAIFRETALEVKRFAEQGILTVEMEAASLFSVAQFRNVSIGAVFVISDRVHGDTWERGMTGTEMAGSIQALLPHLVQFEFPDQTS